MVQTSVADAKTAVLEKTTVNARTIANAAVVIATVVLATTPKGAIAMTEVHAKAEIVTVKAEIATADAIVAHKASEATRQANNPLSSPASPCDAGLFHAQIQTSFLPILSLPLALISND